MQSEKIQKTIKFETELAEKIEELAQEARRNFSTQVKFMLEEYIRIKETK